MIEENDYTHESMLFRFRGDADYNFESLLKNEIYASSPNILNDPLDCPITYNIDKLYKKLLRINTFARNYAESIFPSNSEKRYLSSFDSYEAYDEYHNSIFREACSKLFDPKNAPVVKDFIRALANDILYQVRECFGIVSFTLTCGSRVMRSHYASNYKGFVLAYNLLNFNKVVNKTIEGDWFLSKFKGICGLFKVRYVPIDEIIDGTDLMYELLRKKMTKKYEYFEMIDFLLNTKYKEVLLTLLTTKDKSWEYEQEVRLIIPREDMWHSLRNITKEPITQYFKASECYHPNGIIIGSNMSTVNRAAVGYYCQRNNRVLLQRINTERLMSERKPYLTLIKPQELIDIDS